MCNNLGYVTLAKSRINEIQTQNKVDQSLPFLRRNEVTIGVK